MGFRKLDVEVWGRFRTKSLAGVAKDLNPKP